MKKGINQKGFTLAEVLITLAIIGIVAAMTIPTLINNYQKKIWVNELKKSYATTQQMLKMLLAEEGVDRLSKTSLWTSSPHDIFGPIDNPHCVHIYNGLKKYIKMNTFEINDYTYSQLDGSDPRTPSDVITLSDGTIIYDFYVNINMYRPLSVTECAQAKANGGSVCSFAGRIGFDVNGAKGPNKIGRDLFSYHFSDEGILYPEGGKDDALESDPDIPLESNENYWKNSHKDYYCGTPGEKDAETSLGNGCTARIMENNWVMDY